MKVTLCLFILILIGCSSCLSAPDFNDNKERWIESLGRYNYSKNAISVQKALIECTRQGYRKENVTNCISYYFLNLVNDLSTSISKISRNRNNLAWRLRNYTCSDVNVESSTPVESYETNINGMHFSVNKLFYSSNAKLVTVENFITPNECAILKKHSAPILQRATVSGEDGMSIVAEHRKAQQAPYDLSSSNDPLWGLYTRIINFTNNYNPSYKLHPEGQERFTVIQYNPGDEYMPHCDGSCDGSMYNLGGRAATAIAYCEVAEVGGGTTFTNADIFIKPKKGMAAFFSYVGADGHMDDGLTEHSACPIIQGEKWVVSLWMRMGVTKVKPWNAYDPSGFPVKEYNIQNSYSIFSSIEKGVLQHFLLIQNGLTSVDLFNLHQSFIYFLIIISVFSFIIAFLFFGFKAIDKLQL